MSLDPAGSKKAQEEYPRRFIGQSINPTPDSSRPLCGFSPREWPYKSLQLQLAKQSTPFLVCCSGQTLCCSHLFSSLASVTTGGSVRLEIRIRCICGHFDRSDLFRGELVSLYSYFWSSHIYRSIRAPRAKLNIHFLIIFHLQKTKPIPSRKTPKIGFRADPNLERPAGSHEAIYRIVQGRKPFSRFRCLPQSPSE